MLSYDEHESHLRSQILRVTSPSLVEGSGTISIIEKYLQASGRKAATHTKTETDKRADQSKA